MPSLCMLTFIVWIAAYVAYLWHHRAGRWHRAQRALDLATAMIAVAAILAVLSGSWLVALINAAVLVYVLQRYPRTNGRAWIERTMPRVARAIFWGRSTPGRSCATGACARPRSRRW